MVKRLEVGARVKTTSPYKEKENGWDPNALVHRRWGVVGKVLRVSDAHGLCYHVQHEDGSSGWYDPNELGAGTPPTLWDRLLEE